MRFSIFQICGFFCGLLFGGAFANAEGDNLAQIRRAVEKGNYKQALSDLKRVKSSSNLKDRELILYLKWLCSHNLNRPGEANDYRKELAWHNRNSEYLPRTILAQINGAKQLGERRRLQRQLIYEFPDSREGVRALKDYSEEEFRNGNVIEAKRCFEKLLQILKDPDELERAQTISGFLGNYYTLSGASQEEINAYVGLARKELISNRVGNAKVISTNLMSSSIAKPPDLIAVSLLSTYFSSPSSFHFSAFKREVSKYSKTPAVVLELLRISNITGGMFKGDEICDIFHDSVSLLEDQKIFKELLDVARYFASANRIVEASLIYEILVNTPDSLQKGRCYAEYGMLMRRSGDLNSAREKLQFALHLTGIDPSLNSRVKEELLAIEGRQHRNENTRLAQADRAFRQKKYKAARSLYLDILRDLHQDLKARNLIELKVADCLIGMGMYSEALAVFDKMLASNTSSEFARQLAFNGVLIVHFDQGQDQNATRRFMELVNRGLSPEPHLAWLLGVSLLLSGDANSAKLIFSCLAKLPTDLSGSCQRFLFIAESSSSQLNQSKILNEIYVEFDEISYTHPDLIRRLFPPSRKISPSLKSDGVLFWTASTYLDEENFKEALIRFERLAKENPKSIWAPESLIRISIIEAGYLGNLRGSDETLKQVVERYPQSTQAPQALFYRASLRQWNKNIPEARKFWKQVVQLYPTSKEAPFAQANIDRISNRNEKN